MHEPSWAQATDHDRREPSSASAQHALPPATAEFLPSDLAAFLATMPPHPAPIHEPEDVREALPPHEWPPLHHPMPRNPVGVPALSTAPHHLVMHPVQNEPDYDATAHAYEFAPPHAFAPAPYNFGVEPAPLPVPEWSLPAYPAPYADEVGAPYADPQAWGGRPPAFQFAHRSVELPYALATGQAMPSMATGVPALELPSPGDYPGPYGVGGVDDGDGHGPYDQTYLSAPSSASYGSSGPVSPLLATYAPPAYPRIAESEQALFAQSMPPTTAPFPVHWTAPVPGPSTPPRLQLPRLPAPSTSAPVASTSTAIVRARSSRKTKSRTAVETQLVCARCAKPFALLILRGDANELEGAQFDVSYTCAPCAGVEVHRRTGAEHANLRKRSQTVVKTASCDVCWRDVASGSVVIASSPRGPADEITFYTELICASCNAKYRRCSDCGGGGGPRHGVGKWRTRELFIAERRTCSLDHTRQASAADMVCTFGRVTDFPPPGPLHARILQRCRSVFVNCMLANLASPEMLEGGTAGLTKHEDIVAMNNQGWANLEPMFSKDVEQTSAERTRRYVALRWCLPHPRKSRSRIEDNEGDHLSAFMAQQTATTWFQPVQILVPWATGEGFEGTQLTMKHAIGSIFEDRAREVGKRIAQGEDPAEVEREMPPIRHIWTLLFFDRSSRVIQHMIKKLDFLPLEEYMELYPDAPREAFAPIRQTTRPSDQQEGWIVLVRRPVPPTGPGGTPAPVPAAKRVVSRPTRARKAS